MTTTVTEKTDLILKHAQPAIRDELSRHLAACGFVDPDDPTLNSLVAQSMIVGQPVRIVERGGAALATEAGLARLGDRLHNVAWSLGKLRIGTVVLACSLTFLAGIGGTALAFRIWGDSLSSAFHLPVATDPRLESLSNAGAELQVKAKDGTVFVYLQGNVQASANRTSGGLNYLYFKQP